MHVHVGVRGADRAIAVCDRMRASCPSCWRSRPTRRSWTAATPGSTPSRTQIFTKSFPRCGIPEAFGDWATYADYVDFLKRTNCVVEHTQLWWSVRPHHAYGTVEVRICDAQSSAEESTALAALTAACAAQAALDYDDGVLPDRRPDRLIEENFWRAIRYGLDGKMIDLERGRGVPRRGAARPAAGLDRAGPGAWVGSTRRLPAERRPAPARRDRRGGVDGGDLRGGGRCDPAVLRR